MRTFIDSSAFIAIYLNDDDFHDRAVSILAELREQKVKFLTSNFILDEIYTFLRARKNKNLAIKFSKILIDNVDIIKVVRISVKDEQEAFKFFKKINGKGVSFTDCTSFSVMRRYKVNKVFTFDDDFQKAGFDIIS